MASTRYGRIFHGDHHHNNIKFPSPAAREKFAEEFEKYHKSHDHDGETPRFEFLKASDLKSHERGPKDANRTTIDGYSQAEIKEYHNREYPDTYTHYRPPTCCVSPLIVLERKFIDSGELERHELSSVFGDMPYEEFEHLVRSIETDGFMDPVIRMHEGKILDGWHRYAAALALNLVRKLMFSNYDEEKEGAATAFVAARNLERRHLTPGQRGQIVVSLNERYGWGGDRSKGTNVHLKTQEELAKQANVSTKTIQRAEKVEAAGESEAVITGEKTAGQVIEAETLKELSEKIAAEMPQWKRRDTEKCKHESDHIGEADQSVLIQALRSHNDSDADGEATVEELRQLLELMTEDDFAFIVCVRETLKAAQPPAEPTSETLVDREAKKLENQKKQAVKCMWDTRIQAARDWTGEGDTDLNQYLSLSELEKGFQENNPSYAAAFASAMKRTSEQSYQIVLEKVLASDVELDVLQTEYRTLLTYAGDIRQWQREDWSPDINWILPLIEAKKAAESKKAEPDPELEADLNALWEKVTAQMKKWKQRYKESGYRESELVSRASKSQLIAALRAYHNSEEDGAAKVEELKDLLDLMKTQSYPFARSVRKQLGGLKPVETQEAFEAEQTDADTDSEASEEDTSLAELNLPTLKGFLDTLLDTVGQIEHPEDRDNLSVAIFDALAEQGELTEREMLLILIECAHSIVTETQAHA